MARKQLVSWLRDSQSSRLNRIGGSLWYADGIGLMLNILLYIWIIYGAVVGVAVLFGFNVHGTY